MTKEAYSWAILAALVWGIVPVLEKVGLSKVHPDVGLFFRCLGVIIGVVILLVFKFNSLSAAFSSTPSQTVLFLIASGFLASFVAQLFFYRALKLGEASRVVPISAAYPLIAFFLAVIFLSEKITLAKFIGICFVLLGVYFLR
jgi:transporter family protein